MRALGREALVPVLSVVLAVLIGGLFVVFAGHDPATAVGALWRGAFGDVDSLIDTLSRATPIAFTGLSVALAFRGGLFNVGAEGQLYVGAMAAAIAAVEVSALGGWAGQAAGLLAAAAAGALWGAIPGWLKARFGVHEVINTIMLNFIAVSLTSYLVLGPYKRPGAVPRTPDVPDPARLGTLLGTARLSTGVLLALLAAALVWFLLWRTVRGFEIRAVGHNPLAAEAAGISVGGNLVFTMSAAGLLAGLAGAERVMGFHGAFIHGFSPGYGFEGIAVGLLGRNHPVGALLAALVFGGLSTGGLYMDMAAGVPSDLVTVVQALIVFLVGADQIIRALVRRRGQAASE